MKDRKDRNRRRPIRVLMIDDDIELATSIKNRGKRHQVLIDFRTNYKDGFDTLLASEKYQAVILDGKAPMTANQPKGTEAENFVHEAITRLNEIRITRNRVIPFCVHTAWYVQLEPGLRNRVRVFDKKKTSIDDNLMAEMFSYLHKEVGKLEQTKIEAQHKDVFDFVNKYLDEEDRSLLLDLLKPKQSGNRNDILNQLAFVRRLEESVLNVFCKECLGKDPLLIGGGGQSRGKHIIEIIKRHKYAPVHVSFMTFVIYTTLSSIVSHKAPTSSEYYNYPITNYTVMTFVGGLLDIIIWVKNSIENGLNSGSTSDEVMYWGDQADK